MNFKSSLVYCLLITVSILVTPASHSQTTRSIETVVEVSYAKRIGVTKPVQQLAHQVELKNRNRQEKKRHKPLANFPGRRKADHILYPAPPFGEDPVRQRSIVRGRRSNSEPILNVEGIDREFVGARVPDSDGDIGKDHYVQCVNASFYQVFDKQGNRIGNPIDFNTLWTPLGFTSAGDPVIIYDQEFDRWIITEFPNGNQLLIAVSETSDPLGSFVVYNFATPRFPDYPKYGLWKNTVYLTTNEGGPGVHHTYFLDRTALINGDQVVPIQRVEIAGAQNAPGFMVATPVDWSGSIDPAAEANPMVIYIQDDAWGDVAQDQIELFTFDVDFDNENNTIVTQQSMPTAPFDSDACSESGFGFECIPQPNSDGMDGLPWTIMNQTHYRNFGNYESIVLNFIVDYTGTNNPIAGIRWVELRRTNPSEDWIVYQEGTFAPQDGLHRFMGSISQDGLGNIGLAYNVASDTEFAGLRYTGRRVNDPLGLMTLTEYTLATGESATSDDRFGDYATMSVDPEDDRTFWFTGEYMKANNSWGTKVVAFRLERDTIDIGIAQVLSPLSGPDLTDSEIATVVIKNFGLTPITNFIAGFQLANDTAIIDTILITLASDSSYTLQFNSSLDLSNPGLHQLRFFTMLDGDTNPTNDNLISIINNVPYKDASIVGLENFEAMICGDQVDLPIILANIGIDTLISTKINLFVNGIIVDSILWSGSLAMGESEIVNGKLINLADGMNELQIVSELTNGNIDQVTSNDTFQIVLTAASSNQITRFILKPDRFPEEITWQVADDNGLILFTGGPYADTDTLIEVNWCLAPTCHTFTIFDSADDGICCTFGEGTYEIIDPIGNVLIASNGDYGSEEISMFCLDSCVVSAEINITPESDTNSNDADVMIAARNGKTPYRFSLDGGNSFQIANLFTGLTAGEYYLVVQDRAGCLYRDTFNITACNMNVMISSTDESVANAKDGSITFDVDGGTPPLSYSIDAGTTFQVDTIFTGLSADLYSVVVNDALGCSYEELISVDLNVAIHSNYKGQSITLFPNPNDGHFYIEVSGMLENDLFLPYHIYNAEGKLIRADRLVNYSNTFTGEITIERFPAGTYYVVFPGDDIQRMLRIIKE